jgi:hypothetical protein
MGNRPGSLIYKLKHGKRGKRLSSKSIEPTSPIDNTYLETFLLVWLDPHVETRKENIRTQKRLREILTCLITFDKVDTCEQWLKKCCTNEKIILIVSGAYGQEIVPRIHDLPTIVTIYIYCLHVDLNKIWAKDYPKIRSVQSSTDNLLQELSHNQINLESVEDSKALKIYKSDKQISSLDTKIASLIWYQLLLEILIFPGYFQSKGTFNELIQILRQYCSDDEYGSNLIDEFEQTYEPKRAVLWLIRDTPLVRFVNKALREQDINILFALRFLLVDIHSQLIENQVQSLNVFKLRLMSKSQMEDLRANPGQFIVIHGFLFASTNMSQLMSTVTNNDQFETILFDIKADFRPGVAPFAFLHTLDSNIEQQIDREILFMCGSIFEVGPLIYENSIWKLRLRLASENDIPILLNMKQKLRTNQNLTIIGDLLNQCDQREKATVYLERLHNERSQLHSTVLQTNKQSSKKNSKSNFSKQKNFFFLK